MLASWLLLAAAQALPAPSAHRHSVEVMNDGVALAREDNVEGAVKALREAIALEPGNAHAWLNLGHVYRRQGRLAEAEEAFGEGLAAQPTELRGELSYWRGLTMQEQSRAGGLSHAERVARTEEALGHLQAAANADPWRAQAYHEVGRCHEFLDQPAKADAAYRRAIEADPRLAAAYSALGMMYIDYGFANVGMAVLDANVTINDGDAGAWTGMGRALLQLGRAADAVEPLEKALALDPEALDALYSLGMVYAELRDRKQAVERLEQFVTRAGADVPPHLRKAALDTIARMQDVL